MEFWQSIKGKWNQLVQWTLWRVAGSPSNAPESAVWYDTTEHRAALKDDSKTQHLAHVEDLPNYSGVFTLPTITVGAGGVLTIGGDGYIYAREDANYTGIPKLWNPAGATLNLVSGADQWLVYTAGVGYSITTINPGDAGLLSNKVPLYRYQYEFGRVHSEDQDQLARGQSEKNAVRVAFTEFYKRVRETGLELTMSNLLVNISGAYVYRGPVIDSVVPFVGGTNQLYRHSIANGTWSEATVAGIDTSIYNPSTGIATLQAQKFAWAHVYRSIGDAVEAFVVYGDSYYSTEAAALAGFKLPSALTATIRSHCVRVASVLYKKGDTTIPSTRVYTAWVESTIGSTGIPNHNELGLIDGGDPANNYYGHLSAAQRLLLVNAGAANGVATLDANGKVPSGQLPSYVDDVLEYATKAGFPATGESGKIYVDLSTNLTWRWSGSTYVEISPSLALGETNTTAYRGDRGKTAYDHSQSAHAPANADNTQAAIEAAAAKTTPVDADVMPLLDSAASNSIKKLTWANIKAALKSYLDTKLARDGSQTMDGNLTFQGVSGTNSRYIQFCVGGNDFARVMAGANAENDGWLEIATADDGQEPIYLRQYIGDALGVFSTVKRSATLLDALGNTQFPGTVTATGFNGHATSATHSWAMRQDGIFTARNIDVPLGGHGEFIAYNVHNPEGALPMSSSWCYITEHHHSEDDNLHYVQTFIDFWANRKFWRTCEWGVLSAWAEDATTAWVKDVAAPTSHASTATTYGVSSATNFGHAMASSAAPAMDGTASAGTDNGKFTREGHVHPSDTSRLAIGDGLSAGTQVVSRPYVSGQAHNAGTIYLEY